MRRRILGTAVAIALVVPGAVAAQACIGIPVAESMNAVTAQIGFPQDAMSYGAALRHNMAGPLSFSAAYGLSSFDAGGPNLHAFGAQADYEVAQVKAVSACPTLGLGYSRIGDETATLSTLSVPVGVGIGRSFPLSGSLSVIPHVVPQWVWYRATVDVTGFGEATEDDSYMAALFGATVSAPRFYVGAGLTWVDIDGMDPVFSINAGVPFAFPRR